MWKEDYTNITRKIDCAKKTTLPKKILSLLKLSFVKKGLFMASESVEQ
jgi:hypothetical protein